MSDASNYYKYGLLGGYIKTAHDRKSRFERGRREQLSSGANFLLSEVNRALGSPSTKQLESVAYGKAQPFTEEDIERAKRMVAERSAMRERGAVAQTLAGLAERGITPSSSVGAAELQDISARSQDEHVADMLQFLGTVEQERFKYPVLAANALKGIFQQAGGTLQEMLKMVQEQMQY